MERVVWPPAVLPLLWVAWCVLHSALAADAPAAAARRRLGIGARGWRVLYNAVAVATLLPLHLATTGTPSPELWAWRGWWRLPQGALLACGIALLLGGARHYDLRQFLGLAAGARGGIAAAGGLETGGILARVRHPWYLAGLLLVWARDLRQTDLLVSAVLSGYLVVGAHLEERRLLRRFGEAYGEYRRRVPMLIPRLRRARHGG